MSVEFHEEEPLAVRAPRAEKPSLFTSIVYKLKLADTPEGAQHVILVAALICLGLTLLLFLNLTGIF